MQAGRAIQYNLPGLIPKIHRSFPELDAFIKLDYTGHVCLENALGFQDLFSGIMRQHLDDELKQAESNR